MNIIGDLKYANKFCIETPDKGILWVPDLDMAKKYVSDQSNKDWFRKTIIATYEQVVRADDGKCYLKSKAPKKKPEQFIKDSLTNFKEQVSKKIKNELRKHAENKGFNSFEELISFSTSSIKKYKDLAKEGIKLRDSFYKYTDEFISKLDEDEIKEKKDISEVYDEYLQNFPFM